jgi:hypothetical protein
MPGVPSVSGELIYGPPPVEQSLWKAASGGTVSPDADLAGEVAVLAMLLAEVVQLAGQRAVYPGRWAQIAELALEHDSVRAALAGWPG